MCLSDPLHVPCCCVRTAVLCPAMQVGQTFTIEPILVEGSSRVRMWDDDWTATTADGGLAAQAEHTVLITPNGVEVLTLA
jgi:methionyl aminopeptidase